MRSVPFLPFFVVVFLTVCLSWGQEQSAAPQMTDEQIAKVKVLVHTMQAHQASLKDLLAQEQAKLSQCYTAYELDDEKIEETHTAITELEHKLLLSHLHLQRELRKIVSPEIFQKLIKRVKMVMDNSIPAVTKK